MVSSFQTKKLRIAAVSAAVALAIAGVDAQAQVSSSLERKNMQRVGHTDLQGRASYQPNVIQYPDGRTILFVGMHNNVPVPRGCPANTAPNSLEAGSPCRPNGTMIIDVTDPTNPVEKALIPSPAGGQSQMVRMCIGDVLPHGTPGHVYLLRNVQGGANAGYEMWDVTNVSSPTMTSSVVGLRSTHKDWWECKSGLMIAPGSKSTAPLWRESQAMLLYDWSNPNQAPAYIRTFGLPGGQPNGTGAVPNSLHGAVSTFEHPLAGQKLARGATANDVIGNRIYAAWGVGDDGIVTIIDRKKLLPAQSSAGTVYGGTWVPKKPDSADNPDEDELIGPNSPTVGYFMMSPDQGGHTSMPVFGLKPPSMQKFNEFATRDFVIVTSEATADGVNGRCNEAPHWAFMLDVTVENSMGSLSAGTGSGTRVEHDPYQGPMVLSTMQLQPQFGERYPRGNYCARGARFGVHSVEENFNNPFYGKLTAVAYFNGGLRIYDIREPVYPAEVAFYVTEANALTDPAGYMLNNVEIDNRGFIYVVDRNGAGMDILQLTGCAAQIGAGVAGAACPRIN